MKKHILSEKLEKALLQLNLTEKEIAVYITLLEKGGAGVLDISRYSGINRVSVYSALDELKEKGLAVESKKGKRTVFLAESPESLRGMIEKKFMEAEREKKIYNDLILPSLKAINIYEEKKPQFKFFEGLSGIYKVYNEYILTGADVLNCGSYDSVMGVSSLEEEKKYFNQIKKKKIFFRSILEDTPLNHEFAEIAKGAMHVKYLPKDKKISADILVSGPMIALISYEKLTATVIEDKSIAASIKMYLEFMWDRL